MFRNGDFIQDYTDSQLSFFIISVLGAEFPRNPSATRLRIITPLVQDIVNSKDMSTPY